MMNYNIKRVREVLLIILFANIFVAALKIIVGNFIKSTSMMADGFHSLSDGSSNVVGLVGIWYAAKPADANHPYGHRKFENLAGLFIGGMLTLVGINVIINAFQKLFNPITPYISLESLFALIVTLGINSFVSWFEYREGRRLKSQILISDSLHTRSDIYVSIGVLVTLVCIRFGLPAYIDQIASMAVAIFVFHAAYEILKETSGILVDKVVVDCERVREIVLEFSDVRDVHKIRSRGSSNDVYIDLHIMTEPKMNVETSHKLIHNIEERIKKVLYENTQVNIHLEPYYSSEEMDKSVTKV